MFFILLSLPLANKTFSLYLFLFFFIAFKIFYITSLQKANNKLILEFTIPTDSIASEVEETATLAADKTRKILST